MPRKKKPVVELRAVTSFAVGKFVVREGETLPSDSPLVKGREALFAPVEVETATAAPGEVRAVTPPSARKAKAEEKPDGDDAE